MAESGSPTSEVISLHTIQPNDNDHHENPQQTVEGGDTDLPVDKGDERVILAELGQDQEVGEQLEDETGAVAHGHESSGERTAVEVEADDGVAGSEEKQFQAETIAEQGEDHEEDATVDMIIKKPVEAVKAAAGGVKKVLKSGIFDGTPKPAPASSAGTGASRPTTTRTSLAPARLGGTARPSTTSTARPPPAGSRLSQSTSATTGPTAAASRSAMRPPATTATSTATSGTTARSRASTQSSASTRLAPRPTTSNTTTTTGTSAAAAARPRPSVKPPLPTATASRTPTATRPATGITRPEPLKAASTVRPTHAKTPSVSSPPPKARALTTTTRPSVASAGVTRPLAGRASLAHSTGPGIRSGAAAASAVGAAQRVRGGSGPSTLTGVAKRDDGKEVAELKDRVEELEKQIAQEKETFEARIAEHAEEKVRLEEQHNKAIDNLRTEFASTAGKTSADSDKVIAEAQERHEASLRDTEETYVAQIRDLNARIESLTSERDAIQEELASVQSQLSSAHSEIASITATVNSVQADLSEIRQAHDQHGAALADVEEAKKALQERVAQLEHEKDRLEEELLQGAEEAEKSVVGITGLEGQIQELQEEVQVLKEQLDSRTREKTDLVADIDQLRQQIDEKTKEYQEASQTHSQALIKASGEAEAHNKQLMALQSTHDQLSTTHADLLEASSKHPEEIAALQAKLNEATERHQTLLRDAGESSQGQIVELERKLAESISAQESAGHEVEETKAKLEEVESELQAIAVVRRSMKEREKSLNEIIAGLEADRARAQDDFDTKYAAAFEDAKTAANEEHAKDLAAIRADLHLNQAQLHEAHSAELESLKAVHATALSDLSADHTKAIQSSEEQLQIAQAQIESSSSQIEQFTATNDTLQSEIKRLEAELGQITSKTQLSEGNPDLADELKKVKSELHSVLDELADAKEMAEMNKSHFEQSLTAMQEYHSSELREAAEARIIKNQSIQAQHERDVQQLTDEIRQLQSEVEDERVGKNNALAQLAEQTRTPPTSPPADTMPTSPSLTKLHEAHNAKVVDLENEIKRLQAELNHAQEAGKDGEQHALGHTTTEGHIGSPVIDEEETF